MEGQWLNQRSLFIMEKEADANVAPAPAGPTPTFFSTTSLCVYEDELQVESNLQKSNSDILTWKPQV